MIDWKQKLKIPSKGFKCGHCGEQLASEIGYYSTNPQQYIYLCHFCGDPTFFDSKGFQTPGPILGHKIKYLSDKSIENLFNEAKKCYSISAFTSSVMCCRKLLMNIAVAEDAKKGQSFIEYVNYLSKNNFIPPNGKKWVDSIRKLGNEANHVIDFKTQKEAERILNFTEMLLRFIYEMPGIMKETENDNNDTKAKRVSVNTEEPRARR